MTTKATVFTEISRNKRNTWLMMAGFIVLFFLLGLAFDYFLQTQGNFLFGFLVFAAGWTLLSYYASPRVTLFLNGARRATKEEYRYLVNIVEGLSLAAGIPTPEIYVIDTPALNAFATGRSPKKSYVVFTKGLIERLDRQELEGVAAHEIAHIANYDIRIQTIAVMLAGFFVLVADFLMRYFFFFSADDDERGGNWLGMLVLLVISVFAAIFAELLKLAISREREYLADASAAYLTHNPAGLASALEKIAKDTRPFFRASQATAHLFLVNPFRRRGLRTWLAHLFSTHPPIEERIKRLRSF